MNRLLPSGAIRADIQAASQGCNDISRHFVRRGDAHAALAGGDEDEFGAAADDADLDGCDGAGAWRNRPCDFE